MQREEGGTVGGAGVTVTATTVERRRVLGEINTARKRAEKEREWRGKNRPAQKSRQKEKPSENHRERNQHTIEQRETSLTTEKVQESLV